MKQVAEFLVYGALTFVGLLLYFVVIGTIIEWPEKAIRWLIAKRGRRHIQQPPPPPRQHHDGFDEPV